MKRVAETKVSGLDVKPPSGRGHEDGVMGELSKGRADCNVAERVAGPPRPAAEPPVKTPPVAAKPGRPTAPYLSWLGQSLRQSYEETLSEPVPENFAALLDRLEDDEDKQV